MLYPRFITCFHRTVFRYDGKNLDEGACGDDYNDLITLLAGKLVLLPALSPRLLPPDDDRAYAYVRFETGDEMSRRAKFAFITWIGPSVGALKKAKVSTDKAFIKEIWNVSASAIIYMHVLIQ